MSRLFHVALLSLGSALCNPAWAEDKAVTFSDAGGAITLGYLDPGTGFTVEAWVRPDSLDYDTIFEAVISHSGRNSFFLGQVNGNWLIEINDTDALEGDSCGSSEFDNLCTPSNLAPGDQHHVAATVTPTELMLYIDGELLAVQDVDSSPIFGIAMWVLGADSDGGEFTSDPWIGTMDEVRIWSRARSAEDIACTRDYALTGAEPDLFALWPLDESTGSSVVTDSVEGLTGEVSGTSSFAPSPFELIASKGSDITCLDYDGDGYSVDEGDCDEAHPDAHPGGTEIWYDGIDQDCDGNDDDADSDGWAQAQDCDDNDPEAWPGADGWTEDCEPIGEGDVTDTASDGGSTPPTDTGTDPVAANGKLSPCGCSARSSSAMWGGSLILGWLLIAARRRD